MGPLATPLPPSRAKHSPGNLRLQPLVPTVAASGTYGCRCAGSTTRPCSTWSSARRGPSPSTLRGGAPSRRVRCRCARRTRSGRRRPPRSPRRGRRRPRRSRAGRGELQNVCGIQQKAGTLSTAQAKVVHIDVQSFIRGLKGEYFKSRVSSLVHLVTVVTRALPCSIPRSRPHRAAGTPCPARAGRRPAAACEAASTPLRTFTEPVRVGPVRNRQWPVNAIPGVPSRSAQGTSLNPWGPARCGP